MEENKPNTDEILKSINVTADDLAEKKFLGLGIYKVKITNTQFIGDSPDNIRLRVSVLAEEGVANADLYFSEKSKSFSLNTIRGILIHNTKEEESKNKIRDSFNNIRQLAQLKFYTPRLINAEAWLKVSESNRSYLGEDDEVHYYKNYNLYAYEPKENTAKKAETTKEENLVVQSNNNAEPMVVSPSSIIDEINMDDVPF